MSLNKMLNCLFKKKFPTLCQHCGVSTIVYAGREW